MELARLGAERRHVHARGHDRGLPAALPYGGNYLIYKEGQAAMKFMAERYGPDRVRDLLQKLKFHRNFDRAFELSLGTSQTKFDEEFQSWLKKTYWPAIRTKNGPEQFARRLTDHRKDRSNINMAAAVSPLGDKVAYISDRRLYTDIYIASTLDGRCCGASCAATPTRRSRACRRSARACRGRPTASASPSSPRARPTTWSTSSTPRARTRSCARSARTSTPRRSRRSRPTTTASCSRRSRTGARTSISTTSTARSRA